MASPTDHAAFEEKVRRTVYIDNLSPQVTESVLRTALDQFGTVKSVQFIPNYMESKVPQCALVEMDNPKQAKAIVTEMGHFPFMMAGMPRPVRARVADMEMFDDRPAKPGRKIHCRWLDPKDPDYKVSQALKHLVQKHAAEASFLLKRQLMEEEKLAEQQSKILKINHKKYETVDSVMADGTARRLARHYNINVVDD